jgi:hypothetical protein
MDSYKLETTFKDLNLGKHFAAAKEALKNFKEKIEEMKSFNKDGQFIDEYFSQLRNEIDIEREVVKLKIDEHYLKLIDEVNDIEHKCKSEYTDPKKSIDEETEKSEEKLGIFLIDFDKLEIDVDNWKNVEGRSNYQIKELNDKILKFKNDLLLNQIYTFESNTTLFDVANNASKIIAKKALIEKGKFFTVTFLKFNEFFISFYFILLLKKSFSDMEVSKFLMSAKRLLIKTHLENIYILRKSKYSE